MSKQCTQCDTQKTTKWYCSNVTPLCRNCYRKSIYNKVDPYILNCTQCTIRFESMKSYAKFCSNNCSKKHRYEHKIFQCTCKTCGIQFENNRSKDYCNKDCYSKYRNKLIPLTLSEKIKHRLRSRLWQALNKNHKSGSAVRDLGCSIEDLKKHLESKFQEGMAWENYGSWHIDHIIPLAAFDLTSSENIKIVCNFNNLQPLWAKDNLSKGDK
jgi:hypothetical protein